MSLEWYGRRETRVRFRVKEEVAMPVYGFECRKCGHKFEEMLSFEVYEKKAKKGLPCPKCHSKSVEQVIQAAMVQTSKKS